jgi:hypothetical protein
MVEAFAMAGNNELAVGTNAQLMLKIITNI